MSLSGADIFVFHLGKSDNGDLRLLLVRC